jgi:uncharacterized protein YceK
MRRPAELFLMLALGLAAAGCGSPGPTTTGTPTAAPVTAASTTAAGSDTGGCPLAAEDLSAATAMTFERATTEPDRALETLEAATIEGNIASEDRTVNVYFVNADEATAAALTPKFDGVLDAVD